MESISNALVQDVDLLSLDAGNTIVFFDPRAAAIAARDAGYSVDADALASAEGPAKRALEHRGEALAPSLPDPEITPSWSAFMRTMVELAHGFDRDTSAAVVRALWRAHMDFNLWRRIPDGLIDAVQLARDAGIKVCVVSNSEGRLVSLFERLGIERLFDLTLDSSIVGVEKPDPRIFDAALKHFGIPATRTLHLGDTFATDVLGARAAGIRTALIDPFGHYLDVHSEVPRVSGVTEVARALAKART